jgi:hypothetical protein
MGQPEAGGKQNTVSALAGAASQLSRIFCIFSTDPNSALKSGVWVGLNILDVNSQSSKLFINASIAKFGNEEVTRSSPKTHWWILRAVLG